MVDNEDVSLEICKSVMIGLTLIYYLFLSFSLSLSACSLSLFLFRSLSSSYIRYTHAFLLPPISHLPLIHASGFPRHHLADSFKFITVYLKALKAILRNLRDEACFEGFFKFCFNLFKLSFNRCLLIRALDKHVSPALSSPSNTATLIFWIAFCFVFNRLYVACVLIVISFVERSNRQTAHC